jgi:hypothetical protein
MKKRFMYVSTSGTTYGPVFGKNEKDARKYVLNWMRGMGVKVYNLRGYYFFEESQEQADKKHNELKESYADVLKANPQLCLTDFM